MMNTSQQITETIVLVTTEPSKQVVTSQSDSEDSDTVDDIGETQRGHWAHKLDSFLSLIGYCVGYGNIWRFPYFCMRNGGGSFLVAFLCILVVCGLPTYFLDLVMGQFSGKTSLHAWQICPLLQGIGSGALVVLFVINTYYNMIIAWTLFYLGCSFVTPLPWKSCDNSWNTADCISNRTVESASRFHNDTSLTVYHNTNRQNGSEVSESLTNSSNLTYPRQMMTSEEEFWRPLSSDEIGEETQILNTVSNITWRLLYSPSFASVMTKNRYRLLEISPGIDVIGDMPWHLAVCFLAAWLLTFLSLIRGVRSAGKVVYVTALLPYVILTAILIRALLLPGAGDGILYFITPNLLKLVEPQVWLEAALQVFYSLGPGWGPLITLASYNKFNNNCFRDSILMVFISEGTSIYGGFVVFAVLGFMAHETGLHISDVVTSGPGLVFMTYPEALAHLPLPNVWTVLFFLMMVTVGLDSQLSCVETIISAIMDQFPVLRQRRVLVQGVGCVFWYFLGLILCAQGGMYVFIVMDWYVALAVPLFAFLECIIVGWIYGAERFSRDVELMLGRGIPVLMRIAICFIAPSILLTIAVSTVATYKAPTYGEYQFPVYVSICGVFIGLVPLVPVVVGAVRAIRRAQGKTFFKRVINASKPSVNWKPASRAHARDYTYDELSEYDSFYSRVKLNILGPERMKK